MRASDPLKSKRFAISLLDWSTAFFSSTLLTSETTSNEGMANRRKFPGDYTEHVLRSVQSRPEARVEERRCVDETPAAALRCRFLSGPGAAARRDEDQPRRLFRRLAAMRIRSAFKRMNPEASAWS